ncbi:MAG: SDR family NAD(P)-dependent oxidoreductase [bacterium]
MTNLKNKIVFITGATSGIGKSCANIFANEGANLILCARRYELLKEVEAEIIAKYGVKIYSFKLDVRNHDDVIKTIAEFPEEWKGIDILINNAGLGRNFSPLHKDNMEGWEEMIDTNIKGVLYVTREVIPLMITHGSGHIVNLGSIAGHEAYPNGAVYCATKFAVGAITKSMRAELVDKKIRVSTVDPGMVETNFSNLRFYGDTEKAKNVYRGVDPLTGDDIADAILYCTTRPTHVNINEMLIMPSVQASSTVTYRRPE